MHPTSCHLVRFNAHSTHLSADPSPFSIRIYSCTPTHLSGACCLIFALDQVTDVKTFNNSALPYQGRYPSGSLYYKGVWYYGTYSLGELSGNEQYPCHNWCVQGPFVGFRWSEDNGATWTEPRMEMAKDFASYVIGFLYLATNIHGLHVTRPTRLAMFECRVQLAYSSSLRT
jgi:hypothetical protein